VDAAILVGGQHPQRHALGVVEKNISGDDGQRRRRRRWTGRHGHKEQRRHESRRH
jgi:hypothetical protein